jgi:phospholipase/carboxylesterase
VSADPHAAGPLTRAGPTAATARRALVILHGRGGDAAGMIAFAQGLGVPDVALFAPEAAGRSWWPVSFLAPAEVLAPWAEPALLAVDRALEAAAAEGFADDRIVLAGFSQGGCLALEHAARRGRPLAAVFGLSASLLGTGDADGGPQADLYGHPPKRFDYAARLEGLPVRIACHERDPHIPLRRVQESRNVFAGLGAAVDLAIMPGEGHGIGEGDVAALRGALAA